MGGAQNSRHGWSAAPPPLTAMWRLLGLRWVLALARAASVRMRRIVSCSASVCNVMSAAVCRYFCTAFTVRVVQSAVFLYNSGLILVRCAPMVDA